MVDPKPSDTDTTNSQNPKTGTEPSAFGDDIQAATTNYSKILESFGSRAIFQEGENDLSDEDSYFDEDELQDYIEWRKKEEQINKHQQVLQMVDRQARQQGVPLDDRMIAERSDDIMR